MSTDNRQSGLISILTLLFFMIFISILVVGFVKIMNDEARQTADNDLSASALAAAQSGIEDGKRIIVYCTFLGSPSPACDKMMTSGLSGGDCSGLGSAQVSGLRGALKISDTNQVGDATYRQQYSCLTIDGNTSDLQATLNEGTSKLLQLKTVGGAAVSRIQVEWRRSQGAYETSNYTFAMPTRDKWIGTNGLQRPPMLRLQFIPYTDNSVDLEASELGSRTIFVQGATNGTSGLSDINANDSRPAAGALRASAAVPIVSAGCSGVGALGYTCSKSLNGLDTSKSYYVRLSMLYGDTTDVTLRAYDSGGTLLSFAGVQPRIDSTGRANDVFRRVSTRVSFSQPGVIMPEFAVESAAPICKNIVVTALPDTTNYTCDINTITNTSLVGQAGITSPFGGGGGGGGGTPCYDVALGNWSDPKCWRLTLTNSSLFMPGTLVKCEWNWGDGVIETFQPSDAQCQNGTKVFHQYTAKLPVGTKVKYVVKLTIFINNGTSSSASYTVWRPL